MAAQGKTTAVHFGLIFFVMLSVILGVVAYLFYSDYREQNATAVKEHTENGNLKAANDRYQQEVEALKKVIGVPASDVGVPNADEKSVIGQANAAIAAFGKNPADPTLVAALRDLRAESDKLSIDIAERQNTIAELQRNVEALKAQYQTLVDAADQKRQATEQDLAGVQGKVEESLLAKDKQIGDLQTRFNAVQTELAQTIERFTTQVNKLTQENDQYIVINTSMRERIKEIERPSFEVADGQITRVDQVARTVYINLGSRDGLKKRTTFSVYDKKNAGIGRDAEDGGRPEDIKGSIEVIAILNNGLAEARILDDTSGAPMSPGDLIYTPLWSPGRTEKFAFVGLIDIDRDGSYVGDRERLHELVNATGAEISGEVTDKGERLGGPIDEQTRFLVVGTLPDLADEPDAARRAEIKQMMEARKEMKGEADRNGVRVVSLNQFLDYVGFVPQRQLWIPGENLPFRLEAGAHSADVRGRGGNRPVSTGQTSGLFSDRKRANPQSGGATSQIFGGRGTGTGY